MAVREYVVLWNIRIVRITCLEIHLSKNAQFWIVVVEGSAQNICMRLVVAVNGRAKIGWTDPHSAKVAGP